MNGYSFNVIWSDEDAAYVATCPEFDGVSAFGATPEEAIAEAQIALDLAIEAAQEEGWILPEPRRLSSYSGQFRLRLPRTLHAQLAQQADAEQVSLNTLVLTLLSQALGMRQSEDAIRGEFARVLESWRAAAETMHAAAIELHQHTSEITTGTFQDPTLRRLYAGSSSATVKLPARPKRDT